MTKEETIRELKILKENYWDDDGYGHETKQYDDTMSALDMAIKSLEQETVSKESYDHEYFLRKELELKIAKVESVLAGIKEEINSPNRGICDYYIVDRIEEIIDKYKAESEET